jgi:pyruvate/2-oxoglutarate dehydrogenase complex dihydrolipoamide acyltransferase (E2) component
MSVMRKKIAEHMVLSRRTSAHVTTVYEIDMTRIARLRDQHRDAFYQRTGTKLTFMPFIFEAVNKGIAKVSHLQRAGKRRADHLQAGHQSRHGRRARLGLDRSGDQTR